MDNLITRLREYQAILCEHGYNRLIDDYFWMLEPYLSFRGGDGVVAIGRGEDILGAQIRNRSFKLYPNINIFGDCVKGNFQVQTDGRITRPVDMSWEECGEHYGQEYSIYHKPLQEILTTRHL